MPSLLYPRKNQWNSLLKCGTILNKKPMDSKTLLKTPLPIERKPIRIRSWIFPPIALILLYTNTTSSDYTHGSLTDMITNWIPGLSKDENASTLFFKDLNFPEIKYKANLEIDYPVGEEDEESSTYFRTVPKILNAESQPPTSTNALRYRVQSDIKLLRKALKNKGYFEGEVSSEWKKIQDGEIKEHDILLIIQTGPRYTFSKINIVIEGDSEGTRFSEKAHKHADILPGSLIDLDKVTDSLVRLKKYFQNSGYPLVEILPPYGKIDAQEKTLTVTYKIILKGQKKIGDVTIVGLENLTESYVRNRLTVEAGEIYDNRKLDRSRQNLLDSELFSSLTLIPSPSPQDVSVPLTLQLLEAPPRSVGVGIRYATQEGIGGKVFWQHRNFWGSGERVLAKIEGSQLQVDAILSFEKPDFFWQDFTLVTKLEGTKANTKAYKGDIYTFYGGVRHKWTEQLTYNLGGLYEYSHLKQEKYVTRSFTSIPLDILYDTTNDPINPFRGWKLKFHGAPFFGDIGENHFMAKTTLFGSCYARFVKKDRVVVALWGRVGKILASPLNDVPLDKRLYSGGINSVRGYGFQRLGPISHDGKPTGGRSQIEMGLEPRVRVGENLGLCVFVEAGKISATGLPKGMLYHKHRLGNQNQFLVGYGLGAKYYTEVGPIRFDIALPTKRRTVHHKKYDAPFQLYLSIGQSF